jgi:hypothetical protein
MFDLQIARRHIPKIPLPGKRVAGLARRTPEQSASPGFDRVAWRSRFSTNWFPE